MALTLSEGGKQTLANLAGVSDAAIVKRFIFFLLQRRALSLAGKITRDMRQGPAGLRRRTGSLARSITGRADVVNGLPAIRVGIFSGPSQRYAGVLEEGTKRYNPASPYDTIRPKPPRRFLAVPTDKGGALTPAGVARFEGPRKYPRELVFIPGPVTATVAGRDITAGAGLYERTVTAHGRGRRTGARSRGHEGFFGLTVVYLLLRKADIRPRWFLRNGLNRHLPAELAALEAELAAGLTTGVASA